MYHFKLTFLICLLGVFLLSNSYAQSIGIGTNNPNPSSVIDISSTNKGLLLPRLDDTTLVSNPAQGLVIYNKNANVPQYFNGTHWNSLNASRVNSVVNTPIADSITYSVNGGPQYFASSASIDASTLSSASGSLCAGFSGLLNWPPFSLSKALDSNSIIFLKGSLQFTTFPKIEIFFFHYNSTNPFFSIKLSNFNVASNTLTFITANTVGESYQFYYQIIGYKNWVTGQSFSYSNCSHSVGAY